ncbi:MAG: pimeloyl-ACP methyl ester esterase BioH [Enterobacter sichuanensis]|jgi:pimeloyl-[acyl-carrier protein] methyl ester esterase|uniref:Pimeloyl-[acyl-carrier protein] methyl ester esterase n=2 Tax=Enterobacter cloacae complex TaxID=354276 RepID=A0A0F1ATW0_9ENTR|nr:MULTISPECIES: pimeloyl-ACP methyl ester esterase BioH [Enterobacter]KJN25556.1 carboxylesterase [Enterobacter sichuanensis]MBO2914324.1 pimeloyl-ACP methyl ester esterase BioH [Enterobacter sichuanensis]MBO2934744.1 pimeloyl-ACP methyl ester esterase BioH [Enterobacter sichuanensis]MBY6353246.1 pimeloyl-ACP methyl ester esterase BioH [Enterobacter sichuanensis]MCU6194504.1 pimeloyl-ACP methyl ester esterase BioH [Enterobacter sichuanensis]
MKTLWWQTAGTGNCHLVLLHGWGLNAEVWHCISEELASHFTLHLVDLPGFGRSRGFGAMSLDEMARQVLDAAPQNAIWLGWSLGGLVASQIALSQPERVKALVTVASSPCFSAQEAWPGIKPDVLASFQQQLSEDFQRTVERFLALQTMGTETARQDARTLKQTVLSLPMPEVEVLNGGLEILKTVDLREPLAALAMPHLRIYGYLDGLVPRKVVPLLDALWPESESQVIAKAAHAPFISHPAEFCSALIALSQRFD